LVWTPLPQPEGRLPKELPGSPGVLSRATFCITPVAIFACCASEREVTNEGADHRVSDAG
jgi:hypothetical protein